MKRVLIIGFGSIGTRHLSVVRNNMPNCKIMILTKSHIPELPTGANLKSISLEEAISFNPEIVIIATPSNTHLDFAKIFSKKAKGILIEKPISTDYKTANKFIENINTTKAYFEVAYNLRYFQSLRLFQKIINKRRCGNIYAIQVNVGQHLSTWRKNANYSETVSSQRKFGGGVLLELSHEFDYLNWIFGTPKWISAWIGKISSLDIDVEDYVTARMGYINLNNSSEIIATLNMDFIRHDSSRSCEVICEKGTIVWNAKNGSVSILRKDNSKPEILCQFDSELDESYKKQWIDFIENVNSKKKSKDSIFSAINILKIIDKAKNSNKNKGLTISI